VQQEVAMRREQPVESPFQATDLDGLLVFDSVASGVQVAAPASQPMPHRASPVASCLTSQSGDHDAAGRCGVPINCRSNSISLQVS